MKPTLFICIGGSGMKIGHALKYNFSTYMPSQLLSSDGSKGRVKFLFIENDTQEVERIKPYYRFKKDVFDMDEFIQIGRINADRVVERINQDVKDGKDLDQPYSDINSWVDKTLTFPDTITEIGLAACRQMGRIGLAVGYNDLNSRLQSIVTRLSNIANKEKAGKPEPAAISVYIITGICGGTGSSMFLDISAMLDNLQGRVDSLNKKAIFINTNYYLAQKLSDPNMSPTHSQYLNLQINSVAMMSECEFFYKNKEKDRSLMGRYSARNSQYESNVASNRSYSPFTNAYLFDIIADNTKRIPPSKFFYVVADMLYYSAISQSNKQFESSIEANATVTGTEFDAKMDYNTLALRVVQYPSEDFSDYFQKRYIFEVFHNVLLNKNLDGKKIEEKAKEFIHETFEDDQSVFAGIIGDYKTNLSIYQERDSFLNDNQYLNDSGKLMGKEDFILTIDSHVTQLNELKIELDQARKSMPDLGFRSQYNTRTSVADQLRNKLIRHSQDIILSQGFYGVLGINEGNNIEKGLLSEIHQVLRSKYNDLTELKTSISEHKLLDNILRLKNILLDKINKLRLVKLSFEKIKPDVDNYHEALRSYVDQIFNFNTIQILQETLHYFAVGEIKNDIIDSFYPAIIEKNTTELNKYRRGLATALGTAQSLSSSNQSLISIFDKGPNDDSDTIRNNYTKSLPNRWNGTKDDLFTVYVPQNLYEYTDTKTLDNWKEGTDLDENFKKFITIDRDELEYIFTSNPKTDGLLARLGLDLDKINININLITTQIEGMFYEKYINVSTHPIAQYINKTIQEVFNEGSPEIQELITGQKHNLSYPICEAISPRTPQPYLNIHPNLKKFAQEQLKFDEDKIVEYDEMPRTQLAFVGIIQGIDLQGVAGNDENVQIYKDRNLSKYRPHLHRDWNDFVYGPYDSLKIESDPDKFTVSEALLICYFFNKLVEHVPDFGKVIFIQSERTLITNNGISSIPIKLNTKNKSFFYFSEGHSLEEKEQLKFFVKKNVKKPDGINLGKLFENYEFDKAFKTLKMDDKFGSCFNAFITTIKEHKNEIADLITAVVNESVSQDISTTQSKLEKIISRQTKTISHQEMEFVTAFSSKSKEMIDGLLDITLDM
jgi:hypothetical protein